MRFIFRFKKSRQILDLKITFNSEGNYSFDELNLSKIKIDNVFTKDLINLKLDFDYKKDIKLEFINYEKPKNSIANFYIELEKKNNIQIDRFNFKEALIQFKRMD